MEKNIGIYEHAGKVRKILCVNSKQTTESNAAFKNLVLQKDHTHFYMSHNMVGGGTGGARGKSASLTLKFCQLKSVCIKVETF